jgi:CspA family cold shock protein
MQAVAKGKVKWFNETESFGYIEMDDGGDVFVDRTAIQKTGLKTLTFGQLVNFDLVRGPQGSVAENVKVL